MPMRGQQLPYMHAILRSNVLDQVLTSIAPVPGKKPSALALSDGRIFVNGRPELDAIDVPEIERPHCNCLGKAEELRRLNKAVGQHDVLLILGLEGLAVHDCLAWDFSIN